MFWFGLLLLIIGIIAFSLMALNSIQPSKEKRDRILKEREILFDKAIKYKISLNAELFEFYKEQIKEKSKEIKIYYSDEEINKMFDDNEIKRKGLESNF